MMAENDQKLLLQVSLNKFTFVIKNILSNEISYFASDAINSNKPIEEQLDKIFSKYDQLSLKYDEIVVLHDNALNTFIPHAFFDSNLLGTYLQYNTKVFSTDFFAFDEVANYDFNNVYVPYININNYLIDRFGTFIYQNINTELVKILLDKTTGNEQTVVYTYLQKDRFELIVANNGKLLFFNSFQYHTAKDFIYYVLFTFEQLNLDVEVIPLILLGRVDLNDSIYEQAYNFIRNVEILNDEALIAEELLLHYQVPKQHYILFHS